MSNPQIEAPVELSERQLSEVQGGIALLLPAVQKVRDAAARPSNVSGETFAAPLGSA